MTPRNVYQQQRDNLEGLSSTEISVPDERRKQRIATVVITKNKVAMLNWRRGIVFDVVL